MTINKRTQNRVPESLLNTWVGLASVFMLILVGLVVAQLLSMAVVGWYVAISLATFLLYAHDKKAAQHDSWRVQEATLHKLALAGGWVGAAFAQKWLRHKSQKLAFRKHFYLMVVGNLIGLLVVWWVKFR